MSHIEADVRRCDVDAEARTRRSTTACWAGEFLIGMIGLVNRLPAMFVRCIADQLLRFETYVEVSDDRECR